MYIRPLNIQSFTNTCYFVRVLTILDRVRMPVYTDIHAGDVIHIPGGIVITPVCLFVCLFVRYSRCDFLKSTSPIFMRFGTDVSK